MILLNSANVPTDETGTVTVAALAPKPGAHDTQQVEWIYDKGSPGRDIYILLPARRHNESAQ